MLLLFLFGKGHYKDGKVYPGLIPILQKLNLNVNNLEEHFKERAQSENVDKNIKQSQPG